MCPCCGRRDGSEGRAFAFSFAPVLLSARFHFTATGRGRTALGRPSHERAPAASHAPPRRAGHASHPGVHVHARRGTRPTGTGFDWRQRPRPAIEHRATIESHTERRTGRSRSASPASGGTQHPPAEVQREPPRSTHQPHRRPHGRHLRGSVPARHECQSTARSAPSARSGPFASSPVACWLPLPGSAPRVGPCQRLQPGGSRYSDAQAKHLSAHASREQRSAARRASSTASSDPRGRGCCRRRRSTAASHAQRTTSARRRRAWRPMWHAPATATRAITSHGSQPPAAGAITSTHSPRRVGQSTGRASPTPP